MKRVVIISMIVLAAVVAGVVAWFKLRGGDGDSAEAWGKMGTFESSPPSEKGFRTDDIQIRFEDEGASRKGRSPSAKGK